MDFAVTFGNNFKNWSFCVVQMFAPATCKCWSVSASFRMVYRLLSWKKIFVVVKRKPLAYRRKNIFILRYSRAFLGSCKLIWLIHEKLYSFEVCNVAMQWFFLMFIKMSLNYVVKNFLSSYPLSLIVNNNFKHFLKFEFLTI